MIKAVLFDLDGTLLNRHLSLEKFINGQHARLHSSLGHIPLESFRERFIELDHRGYVWKDKVYQQLVNEFEIKDVCWEDLLEDYLANFKESCEPFPNLISMLENLKKKDYQLGMITNGKAQFQADSIEGLGIKSYFDVILISEKVGLKKPDVRIFEKALREMNVSADKSIYIGDHPENDVKAARQAGMKAVWKKDAYWESAEADAVIDDLSEIEAVIEKLDAQRLLQK